MMHTATYAIISAAALFSTSSTVDVDGLMLTRGTGASSMKNPVLDDESSFRVHKNKHPDETLSTNLCVRVHIPKDPETFSTKDLDKAAAALTDSSTSSLFSDDAEEDNDIPVHPILPFGYAKYYSFEQNEDAVATNEHEEEREEIYTGLDRRRDLVPRSPFLRGATRQYEYADIDREEELLRDVAGSQFDNLHFLEVEPNTNLVKEDLERKETIEDIADYLKKVQKVERKQKEHAESQNIVERIGHAARNSERVTQ